MKISTIFAAIALMVCCSAFSAHAQNQMRVGGQFELGMPMGDYSDSYSSGWGLVGNFHYQIQPRIWLTGTVGYETFPYDSPVSNIEQTGSFIPILVGVRYELSEDKQLTPYIGAQAGLNMWSISRTETGFGTSKESTNSGSSFGFGVLVGTTYSLSSSIILDGTVKYNTMPRAVKDGGDASFIALQVGVLVPLQ